MTRNELLHRQLDIIPSAPDPPVFDVTCPHCGQSWLKTTNKFDPNKAIFATMFRLKKEYRDQGQTFCGVEIVTDSIEGEGVIYPCCGSGDVGEPMCDSNYRFNGRLASREEPETVVEVEEKPMPFTCHICGEGFEKAWQKAIHARKTGHKKVKED